MEPAGACARHLALSLAAAAVAALFLCPPARSTPARTRGRGVTAVAARAMFADGSERDLGRAGLQAPIGRALRFRAADAAALAMVLAR